MDRLLSLSFFLLLLLSGSACSDKETKAPPFLKLDVATVNFLADAMNTSVDIQTNVADWTATVESSATSWLKTAKQGNTLNISVTNNENVDVRNGKIIIKANTLSETINVAQLGITPSILVSKELINIGSDGGDIDLEITANIDYDIIISDDIKWIVPKSTTNSRAEMVTKKHKYEVKWNPSLESRTAEVLIQQLNGSVQKKISIVQAAKEGYAGISKGDIEDDIKVKVSSGIASSFQPNENIEKSFDGDMTTIYHSSWNNQGAEYFPITLDYNFVDEESIDYLIYHPRQQGGNGHLKEVEIWLSTVDNPTFVKLMDYDFKGNSSATRISFEKSLIKPKTVRFVVKSGAGDGQGFASCAEMEFYRLNPNNFDPLTLFTDKTCSELKPNITRKEIEEVSNNLYRNIALYMFEGIYPREFRIDSYKAWPHPTDWSRRNKTNPLSLLDNPTGISVEKDDEFIVFVGDTYGNNLSLKIQNLDLPDGDGYNDASSTYPLTSGVNKIIPRNSGLGYVLYHTPDYKTAPKVKIHFATGKVNGYYDSQKHQPEDWSKYLNAACDKYFDVLGEHAHLTFPTESFKAYASNNGPKLINTYDELVALEKDFMGLNKYNRETVNRAYFHVIYTAYMYSTSFRTAYNVETLSNILNVNTLRTTPWGPAHEVGHSFQTRPGFLWHGMTEVSNNVHSLYVQTMFGNASRIQAEDMERYNNRYEKAYHSSFVNNISHPAEKDDFCKLVSLWQLQLYFANAKGNGDFYKDYYEKVRVSPDLSTPEEQQLQFVKDMCEVSQTNLLRFFKRWGYLTPFDGVIDDYGEKRLTVTQEQIDEVVSYIESKNYPEVTNMIEYISDANWEVFKNSSPVQKGSASVNGKSVTMSNWKNVVAYEVYEGENLIFVSNSHSFNLDSPAKQNTKIYAVGFDGKKIEVTF